MTQALISGDCLTLQKSGDHDWRAIGPQVGRALRAHLESGARFEPPALPKAGLINVAGILYGTTSAGGPKNWGTVFSVDLATGKYTVFANAHGISNTGALVRIGAELYGTAYAGGGSRQCGIIFSFDFKTGLQKIAYSFQGGADGANPAAGLIAVDGTLYGTTYYGGSLNDGTVFSYKP